MIDSRCEHIANAFEIRTFVETGTDMAETVVEVSRWFSARDTAFGRICGTTKTGARSYNGWNAQIAYPLFEDVKESRWTIHSVDLDKRTYLTASKLFESNSNICFHHQSSDEFVAQIVDESVETLADNPLMFFLDAHWGKYWPIRDEIREILRLKRSLIVIDDFFVPGKSDPSKPHGEYGFEVHRGSVLDWAYIRDLFDATNTTVAYAVTPNRDRRGWAVILVGYSKEEIGKLDPEQFFHVAPDDSIHLKSTSPTVAARFDSRNVVKRIVPLRLLRSAVRIYQRLM